ncbi:uncharacterized protein B0H18DRAFT_958357 [Fomitopsis serialis]|uniref:uncharacterized protein n=1 Tax=Fomitopsis serialis TaxID=139415 RepID=UPI00200801A3|nr:uncharacterized protein B0H18DRAFT_958357 [Neoantrodia serialis]KAH9917523.1 hypothetical protein B0H18DRAFT_958357 [Neoantrodia serialis]
MSDINVTDGPPHASGSGLKLVLPSLKSVQALKGQKRKKSIGFVQDEPKPKNPRPIKLKPLKEVLSKLIVQIKKKDDYAFFLQPVDTTKVLGYADLIKRPMDLGTMTTKVEKGRYRSLEEFADDLRLVTANAKAFNPPGTIYHTEADRIEAWGLDHISKAAGTVIEYETDWNIDVERDNEPEDGERDQERAGDGEKGTPMDVDDGGSVVSAQTPVNMQSGKRRAGANAKKPPGALSESLEADGGLPGAKDGLGAFPPGSDWAELMLALKLKGKRYRTKKERLRMERGGPPYRADGSLDYTELEDPFSVLQVLVPDPPARPLLTPLYPPAPSAEQPTQPNQPSTSTLPPFPTPVTVPTSPAAPEPSIPSLNASSTPTKKRKRRHWTIVRNAPSRRAKEREDEDEEEPPWKAPRIPSASDYGSFAELQNILATEGAAANVNDLGSERRLLEAIRTSVEGASARNKGKDVDRGQSSAADDDDNAYWRTHGDPAHEYIRDVVYGGVDGYAYARSIAQFVHLDEPLEDTSGPPTYDALGMPLAHYVSQHVLDLLTGGLHSVLADAFSALHDPVHQAHAPERVRAQIALSLQTFPSAARALAALSARLDMTPLVHEPDELYSVEAHWAGNVYREEKRRREEEEQARGDAAAFLRFAIEQHQEAQAQTQGQGQSASGDTAKAGAAQEDPEVLQYVLGLVADTIEGMINARTGVTAGDGDRSEADMKDATMHSPQPSGDDARAVSSGIDVDVDIDMEPKDEPSPSPKVEADQSASLAPAQKKEERSSQSAPSSPAQPDAPYQATAPQAFPIPKVEVAAAEDPAMRALRMNLLGLAKRAPLQAIAPLPAALVPENLRSVVPLLPT